MGVVTKIFARFAHDYTYNPTILKILDLPLVIEVYPGKDNLVRVATVKTHSGIRTRPVTKLVLLLPSDE